MEIKEKNTVKKLIIMLVIAVSLILILTLSIVSLCINNDEISNVSLPTNDEIISKEENSFDNSTDKNAYDESIVINNESSEDNSDVLSDEASDDNELSHGWFINKYGYTYLYGDSGFEQFNYSIKVIDRYANSLNSLVSIIPETTNIYNILAPVSSEFVDIPRDIYVKDNFYNKSQSAFSSTAESKFNDRINNISIINDIENQYNQRAKVFFRTDKNWTALAAYTAYRAYCEAAGINAYALTSFPEIDAGDYLGRFYLATNSTVMSENPDKFICYGTMPSIKTTLTIYDNGIIYSDYSLCGNEYDKESVYNSIFLGMTAGRYEINTTAESGSLLIIGDSSAYPLIPFLASHYRNIDLIDPQYFDNSLNEFLSEHQYDDIITICYTTNATSGDYVPAFNNFTGVITENE